MFYQAVLQPYIDGALGFISQIHKEIRAGVPIRIDSPGQPTVIDFNVIRNSVYGPLESLLRHFDELARMQNPIEIAARGPDAINQSPIEIMAQIGGQDLSVTLGYSPKESTATAGRPPGGVHKNGPWYL
jgi:hypothetical protein